MSGSALSSKSRRVLRAWAPWLLCALAGTALLGLLHLAGLRADVAVLSGNRVTNPMGGIVYVLLWFAVVVGAPATALGACWSLLLEAATG